MAEKLHRVSPSNFLSPAMLSLEKGATPPPPGTVGITFGGFWDREEGYLENVTVIYKGRTYINIVAVPPFVNSLGPDLTFDFLHQEPAPPNTTLSPKGLIVPGYSPSDIILRGDPRWQDGNNKVETTQGHVKAQMWELIQSSPGGLIKVVGKTSGGELNLGLHGGLALYEDPETGLLVKRTYGLGNPFLQNKHEPGTMKACFATDILNGEGLTAYGILWDGPELEPEQDSTGVNTKQYFEEHPAPTHRFYIIVSGATKHLPGPPFGEVAQTLPWAYELETEIENLVAEPGNLPPNVDLEHWLPF
jgi:hypothetical protein